MMASENEQIKDKLNNTSRQSNIIEKSEQESQTDTLDTSINE